MRVNRIVVVDQPVDVAFAYLRDFTTTEQWDPGTVTTTRLEGDGGVGTTYLNTSRFLGRETQLIYVIEELVEQKLIRLRGSNPTVTAIDTMTFRPVESGTEVSYTAEFAFGGPARFVAPLLRPAFERLANRAETGMRESLARVA